MAATAAGASRDPDPLTAIHAGVIVDWQAGTLTAGGGAAADLRMPSVDLARPGAERRARAAAVAKLRPALGALPLGGGRTLQPPEIDRALARARAIETQYQSNGGAVIRFEIPFGAWLEPAPGTLAPQGRGEPPSGTLAPQGRGEPPSGTLAPQGRGESPPGTLAPQGRGQGEGRGAPEAPLALTVSAIRLAAAPPANVGGREIRLGAATYRVGVAPSTANALPAKVERGDRLALSGSPDLAAKLARSVVVIYVQKVIK